MQMSNRMLCVLGVDNCTIVFTSYQERKKNDVDWYSPPYYTHSHGYKMCVNVFLASCHTELHVFSYLLPGEYDDGLNWPFRGTVIVRLLNQLSDDNHYDYIFDYSQSSNSESQRVPISRKKSNHREPSSFYLPLAALGYNSSKKCQYLKNDCLKFKVFVKNL